MGDESDAAIWARVREGDTTALGLLIDRHGSRLFRHASRILSQREDAKDAAMVAFAEAWRKRGSVRTVDGSPVPWLLNTVSNVALNLERSSRRYRALIARVPPPTVVDDVRVEDESGVMTALRRLPHTQRGVVVLAVLEGFPHADVADALGISVGTVKSRLSRAKVRLRAELAELEA